MTEPQFDPAYAEPQAQMGYRYAPPPQPQRGGGAGVRLALAGVCAAGAAALAAVPHTGGSGLHENFGTASIVTAAQVALGVIAVGFLLAAAFRSRQEIVTSANAAYRSYQDSAPQRAEAAQRRREEAARYATAAATVASNVGDMYREHRVNRDVPPSVSYPDDVQDYPDFEPDTNTVPVPPTAEPTTADDHDDDGGWGF